MLLLLSLAVLIACWWVGDQTFRTKAIFTVLFLASFGLWLVPVGDILFIPAHCAFIAIVGGSTFGMGWLSRK